MKVSLEKLLKFILDAGIIDKKQQEAILEKSQKTGEEPEDILVADGIVKENELVKIKAYILGIPFINLEEEKISPEVLSIIPEPIARTHNIVAFAKKGNFIEVAMIDPNDLKTVDFIKKTIPSAKILPRLTTKEGIRHALSQYEKSLEATLESIMGTRWEKTNHVERIKEPEGYEQLGKKPEKIAEELPIIGVVDTILKHAVIQDASDIHIEPLEKEVLVRYRVDGILRDIMNLPIAAKHGIIARIKVLSRLKLDETRLPQDGRMKFETEEIKYSVRVSILPVLNGEKVVMRLLSESAKAIDLKKMGFEGRDLELMNNSLKKDSGMILVTGPTGSGKTTTLYSMMGILNTPDVNISTVEDPIEYRMPRINQTQVNSKIGLTFASGLRSLVRQDPDIIMVGEIRDEETVGLAINAALTGHLVLSTLHTTSAAGAIPRMIDMKGEPFLIASTLSLSIAQRLVRRIYGEREKYKIKPAEINTIKRHCDSDRMLSILKEEGLVKKGGTWNDVELYKPMPSEASSDGYKGRIAISEVLPITETIQNLIIKRTDTNNIHRQGVKEGMKTMVEDGILKAARGITSLQEVLRVITE